MKSSNEQIIAELRSALEAGQEVEVLNFYKGIPFTSHARMKSVEGENIVLEVAPPGSVCLQWEQQTWLLCDEPLNAIQATVVEFDILKGLVKVTGLSYLNNRLGRRMIARVEPAQPMPATLAINTDRIQVEVVDVSIEGLGIVTNPPRPDYEFKRGDIARLSMQMPFGPLNCITTIRNITPAGDSPRLSLAFNEDLPEQAEILRYISQRRMEIVNEVQHKYEALLAAARKR